MLAFLTGWEKGVASVPEPEEKEPTEKHSHHKSPSHKPEEKGEAKE